MLPFRPKQNLRATDLNRMAAHTRQQAIQSPSVDVYNNGQGVVVRNPRRASRPRIGEPALLSPAHYNRSVMAKVLEGSTEEGFSIQCYPNYPHDDGRFNAVAFVPSIAFGTLSLSGEWTGKWVLAHYVGLKAIGGA